MKFENFNTENLERMGATPDKVIHNDPENSEHTLVEFAQGYETISERYLKGAFYINKIVHSLLPEMVTDAHQAGKTSSGAKFLESDKVLGHTENLILLNGTHEEIGEFMNRISLVNNALRDIGFDGKYREIEDYTEDESGNIVYRNTLRPWEVTSLENPKRIKLPFDAVKLEHAIEALPESTRTTCSSFLNRLYTLLNEEQKLLDPTYDENMTPEERELADKAVLEAEIAEKERALEALFVAFETNHDLSALFAITSSADAAKSEIRIKANADLNVIRDAIKSLKLDYSKDKEHPIIIRYKGLTKAIGVISGPIVDHDR